MGLDAELGAVVAGGLTGVVAVAAGPGFRWEGASGLADVKTGEALTQEHRFRIASVTKTFVAALALQLIEEATGSILRDELKRRILDPLQLADTELPPDGRPVAGMPRGYLPPDNPLIPGTELVDVTTSTCRSTRPAAEWSRRRAMWRHSW